MTKKVLVLLLFVNSATLFAQSSFNLSGGLTIASNFEQVQLWKYSLNANPAIGFYAAVGYEYGFLEKFGIRGQIAFNQFYSQSTVNNSTIHLNEYAFLIPIDIRYYITPQWSVEAGATIQTYRDIDDFSVDKSHNIRTNLNLGASHRLTQKIEFNFQYTTNLSTKVNNFVIKHPNHTFLFGVSYLFGAKASQTIKSNKNEK